MRGLFKGITAFVLLAGCHAGEPAGPPPLVSWVELAPGDTLVVRALTEAPACPNIEIDGKRARMDERAAPDPAFPVRTCAMSVPRTAASVRLTGRILPLVPKEIKRIVVFGDTGCRLKGAEVQLCNDPKAWPFALVAEQAAAKHPDLVIHVGDYHYRETPCPKGVAGCAGTPVGDNWGVWSADFFTPAAPLLQTAPWVMVRGNHELCGRGGKGWFRFLDPSSSIPDCPDLSEPYAVRFDGFSLAVLDSAAADDTKAGPEFVQRYADAFAKVSAGLDGPFWIATHRPVWGLAPPEGGAPPKAPLEPLNRTEQAALDPRIPPNLDMVVSGHVHTFSSYDFGPRRPAQLVVGVGGSLPDTMRLAAGTEVEIDGAKAKAFAITEYGYLVMDRTARGWDGTLYNAGDDRVLARCTFEGRAIDCR